MNNALDVARYIINYSNERGYGMSNLKLQKILYFVQAYFLTFQNGHAPCFSARIEAWDFGPVVPEVYHEFKQYGSGSIPPITSYIVFDSQNIWNSHREAYNPNVLSKQDRDMIADVVDKFAPYSASNLVDLTHRQAPWKDAYEQHMNKEITVESIRRYFS